MISIFSTPRSYIYICVCVYLIELFYLASASSDVAEIQVQLHEARHRNFI